MKRLVSVFLCLMLLAGVLPQIARAEAPVEYEIGDSVEYVGGEVARGSLGRPVFRLFASVQQLEVAYLTCDVPYLTGKTPATWTVTALGGNGGYRYEFYLFYRIDTTKNEFYCEQKRTLSYSDPRKNTHTFTPAYSEGQYMVLVRIYDDADNYLDWQSPIYETCSPQTQDDPSTIPGKVNLLARQCLSEVPDSEYARALWLHDWLIVHADYDYSHTNYYADGVLLKGNGVCQSYALAYNMLLQAVGMESLYITGYAGDETHAWNLVKIDGEWYHVDCTWDDPGLSHAYFAITDEKMSADHIWTRESGIMPQCTATEKSYEEMSRLGEAVKDDADGLARLDAALEDHIDYVFMYFETAQQAQSFCENIIDWMADQILDGRAAHVVCPNYLEFTPSITGVQIAQYTEPSVSCLREFYISYTPNTSVSVTDARLVGLEDTMLILSPGDSKALYAIVKPDGGTGLTWASSRPAVVSVNGGRITALKAGMSVITVTCANGSTARCNVYVKGNTRTVIPGNVLHILPEAFANCTELQYVRLESGITSVGERAFAGCDALLEISVPATVTQIASDAFDGCEAVTVLCPAGSYAETFAIENGLPTRTAE